MKRLGVDIDGVLCDFGRAYMALIRKESGEDLFPPNAENLPDYPDCWNYPEKQGYDPGWVRKYIWGECIMTDALFWWKLLAVPGAYLVIEQLNRLALAGHEIYFITNRVGVKAKLQTEDWLAARGMQHPTVVVTADKVPIVRTLKLDVFIDDNLDMTNEVARVAEEEKLPVQGHVYLKSAGYNQEPRRGDLVVVKSVGEMLIREGLDG